MAGKNISVNLTFNANTQAAKAQLQSLQTMLNQVATTGANHPLALTPEIQKATQAALNLKIALQNAINVNTGKLDLSKFQSNLKKSQMSIEQYGAQLAKLGPQGVQAFNQLAQSVVNAERPILRLSTSMQKLGTTLMNTVRWSISSAAIQAVTKAVSETVSYAKELDTSLNNIRIVTGKGANEMARFAKEANKMAKQLSVSTTAYTDASLIYYQQGLDKAAVKERTDTTVKLANVVGENAETVSEWMTAIWNNFDNGTKSLESYADVLAKLGAVTASSADEIAGGLEKFASIADTVGLSYEYAASALATITAETRQSEDVVGTALKTIFSRMENLSLGETLEDGTDLGKYSEALKTVGVNIKDANGNLKDMDVILQQTGERWQTLNRDSQIALAQSVAGIRQYAQFMALMDNWDVMEQNLKYAKESTGELEAQNAIYAKSAAAAQERMTAAAENVKNTLFDGEQLKGFYDGLAGILNFTKELVDAFGGFRGLLVIISGLMLKMVSPHIASGLETIKTSLSSMWAMALGKNKNEDPFIQRTLNTAKSMNLGSESASGKVQTDILQQNANMQQKLLENEKLLTAEQKQQIEFQMQLVNAAGDEALKSAEELEQLQQKTKEMQEQANLTEIIKQGMSISPERAADRAQAVEDTAQSYGRAKTGVSRIGKLSEAIENSGSSADRKAQAKVINTELEAMSNINPSVDRTSVDEKIADYENGGKTTQKEVADALREFAQKVVDASQQAYDTAVEGAKTDANQKAKGDITRAENKIADSKENIKTYNRSKAQYDSQIRKSEETLSKLNKEDLALREKKVKGSLTDKDKQRQEEIRVEKDKTKNDLAEAKKQSKAKQNLINQENKTIKEQTQRIKDSKDAMDENGRQIKKNGDATVALGEKTEEATGKQRDFNHQADGIGDNIDAMSSWKNNIEGMVSTFTSAAMGISMITSAFDSLGDSIRDGNASFSDWISSFSSFAMGVMMMIGPITQIIESLKKMKAAQAADSAEKLKGIGLSKIFSLTKKKEKAANMEAAEGQIQANKKDDVSEQAEMGENLAKEISKGPSGWAIAAISAALMAVFIGGSLLSSIPSGAEKEEQRQENIEESQENISTLKEAKEATSNASNLIDELNRLRDAGEDTKQTLEELSNTLPELATEFKSLENELGINLNTDEFDRLLKYYEETGLGLERIQELIKENEELINEGIRSNAKSALEDAEDSLVYSLKKGQGREVNGTYSRNFGGYGNEQEIVDIVKKELGPDFIDTTNNSINDVKVKFDEATDAGTIIDYYERLQKAKVRMDNELTDEQRNASGVYDEIIDELDKLSESYSTAKEVMDEFYLSVAETFDTSGDSQKISEEIFGAEGIKGLENYEAKRDDLIKKIRQENEGLTKEQAETLLSQSEAFKDYENAFQIFKDDTAVAKQLGNQLEQAKGWYDNLPDSLKKYTISVNFDTVNSEEDFRKQILEIRKQAEISSAQTEAESLGADLSTFKSYVEILQTTNEHLEGEELAANKVAVANVRVNKGLESLNNTWTNSINKIQAASKGTYEYAKGIGEIRKSLKEMFGVEPNTEFIETHLSTIQNMLDGNREAFESLQEDLSKEYVNTMSIQSEIVYDSNENAIAQDAETIRNALQGALDELGGLEVGEKITLSDSYLETLQQALDAGQITKEQLEEAFSIKGYDLAFDTKKIPGPTTTKTISGKTFGIPWSTTVTENSEIEVPLLQGGDVSVTGGNESGNATVTRVADSSSLNASVMETAQSNKAKDIKSLNDEVERYHEIEEVIDDLSKEMDKLSKAKDRAFGKDKVKYMQQELDVLDSQIAAQDILLDQTKAYLELDKQNLLNLNPKVQIDKDTGNITNFSEIQKDYLQRLAQIDKESDKYKNLENEYKLFKEYVSKYEETYDKFEEEIENKADYINQQLDKKLEVIDYSVKFNIEINEHQLENLERLLDDLDDDLFDSPERINNLTKQTEIQFKNIENYTKGLTETLRAAGVSASDIAKYLEGDGLTLSNYVFTEETIDSIKDYTDNITDAQEAIEELRTTIEDQVMSTFEVWRDEIEKNGEAFEYATSMIENYKNIIDTVGKDRLGLSDAILKDLNDAADAAAMGSFENAAAAMSFTRQALAEAEAARATATSQKDQEFWDDRIEELTSTLRENTQDLAASWNDYLTQITDSFEDNMANILSTFEDSIAGMNHKSLDALSESFNREQEIADLYLEDYKKIYELSKLNRNISKSIESTDNLKAQRALKDIQAEVAEYQAAGKEMSQYELENLQKKYDLRLAEIALEEAQNAKSQVRLTRDSAGNWGYIYTANETAMADAQQKYEDALYAMQEHNDEYIETMQSNIIQNRQELVDALANLNIQDFANAEEWQKARDEIIAYYTEKESYYIDQIGIALDNNKYLYEQDWMNYSNATGYKITASDLWENDFADTTLAMQTGYQNIEDFAQGLTDALGAPGQAGTVIGDMDSAYASWESNFNDIMARAEEYLGAFGNKNTNELGEGGTAQNAIDSFEQFLLNALYGNGGAKNKPNGGIVGGIIDTTNKIGDISSKAEDSFGKTTKSVSTWQSKFSPEVQKGTDKVNKLNNALDTLLKKNAPKITITTNLNNSDTKLKGINNELEKIKKDGHQTITIDYVVNGKNQIGGNDGIIGSDGNGNQSDNTKQEQVLYLGTNVSGQKVAFLSNGKAYTISTIERYTGTTSVNKGDIIDISRFNEGYERTANVTTFLVGASAKPISSGSTTYYNKNTNGTFSQGSLDKKYKQYYSGIEEQKISAVEWDKANSRWMIQLQNGKWYRGTDLVRTSFDTGGYTGEWGSDGRLAMLHQKELILNADDTENFLAAINIVRSLNDRLEQNAKFASQGLNGITSAYNLNMDNGTLEQEVTIHAEFPNVSDHNEIQIALNDLVNQASQRANRKF